MEHTGQVMALLSLAQEFWAAFSSPLAADESAKKVQLCPFSSWGYFAANDKQRRNQKVVAHDVPMQTYRLLVVTGIAVATAHRGLAHQGVSPPSPASAGDQLLGK